MSVDNRGGLLTVFAIAFGLMAISNFSKPIVQFLRPEDAHIGFVFLGTRLHGLPNVLVATIFGLVLAAYAYSIWNMRKAALLLAYFYAFYVFANLILFTIHDRRVPGASANPISAIVYVGVAIGVSWGSAFVLRRRQAELS